MQEQGISCCFVSQTDEQCCEPCLQGKKFCYWHDPDCTRSQDDLKDKLENWVAQGHSLAGFNLSHACLEDVHLSRKDGKYINLQYTDFYRANLRGAHLYNADLRHSSLMKTDLSGANLNCANLGDANLLGVVLTGAKIEDVDWGSTILQERLAHSCRKMGAKGDAIRYYKEAEEVYRNLHKRTENRGLIFNSGHFFQKEMEMRRFQLPLFSYRRFLSKITDLVCGYGESPTRVVGFSFLVIFLCSLLYFFMGLNGSAAQLSHGTHVQSTNILYEFTNSLYFSMVTFTTLGYGDITPLGWLRLVAGLEAFAGSFTMALFVVVFVKKMTR